MNPSYRLFWGLFRLAFATYFRWRVHHPERVPLHEPVILACNHASFLDPPLVGAGVKRPINFLARESLFSVPIIGTLLRSWHVVPVDRDGGGGAGLKIILDRLRSGGVILLFPEGTRSRDGRLQAARPGIGLTVVKSTAPVIPVRVFNTDAAFGRGAWFPKPGRVSVKYGCPLLFADLRAEARHCAKPRLKQIYQQTADEIMAAIAALEPNADTPSSTRHEAQEMNGSKA